MRLLTTTLKSVFQSQARYGAVNCCGGDVQCCSAASAPVATYVLGAKFVILLNSSLPTLYSTIGGQLEAALSFIFESFDLIYPL